MAKIIGQDHLSITDKLHRISWPFVILITMVASVGVMSLYSAANGNWQPWALNHLIRFLMGFCGFMIVALIDVRIWMRLAYPIYGLAILLLIYVDVRGHIGMGAQRWIDLGIIKLQPSEVMKVASVLVLARFFHGAMPEDIRSPFFLLRPLALVAPPVLLVMIQPDLGTAMTILMVSGAIFFLAGVPYWMFAVVGAAGLAFLPIAWQLMHDYQRRRVLIFLNPESDPLGAGYHISQSKIALGSGGLTGKGYLEGSQSKLNFLPEKQTDFIFTLFNEEWGFMGGASLMLLFITVIAYGYMMAYSCNSLFSKLLAVGIVTNFFIYCFINMGMVMGMLPVVGVPLPMISHGGTAMLSLMFGFGLLMSAYVHRDQKVMRG